MRLRLRWFGIVILLCSLFLNVAPTQAAIISVTTRQPPKITTDQAVYDKITKLKSAVNTLPLSAPNPDDKFILAGVVQAGKPAAIGLLNLEDGKFRAIDTKKLPAPISEFVWEDAKTLTYLAEKIDIVKGKLQISYSKATVNFESGEVKIQAIELPGFPVTLAPGGKRVIVTIPANNKTSTQNLKAASDSELETDSESEALKSPFDIKVNLRLTDRQDLLKEFISDNTSPVARRNIVGTDLIDDLIQLTSREVIFAGLDLTTGELTPMFGVPAGTSIAGGTWTRDGSQIAFLRIFTGLLSVGQYSGGQLLNQIASRDALGELAPDKNPFVLGNAIDTFDFKTKATRQNFLKADRDGNGDVFYGASWSADGNSLATMMMRPSRLKGRANPIYLVGESAYIRFYNMEGQITSTFDHPEINSTNLTPYFLANDEILFHVTRETNNWFYYYNRVSGEVRKLSANEGFSYFPRILPNSRQVLYYFSSFMQAPELFRQNWDGSGLVQVTHANDELTNYGKVRVDPVSFTLANGQQRTGYLLQSANSTFPPKNKRVIVWQEGGPTASVWNQWGDIVERPFNLLPNFDFALLFVPLTGRVGYGPERFKALYENKAFGSADIDEQAEIVQQLIERGWTAQGSVGITGCSYGGYFTTQSTVRHPNLYSAANAQCTLTDMFTEAQFDQTAYFFFIMGASYTTDGAYYLETSPLHNANKVRTPTLLFHGTNDFIPVKTASNYHDQLQRNGIPVNLLAFGSEGHGLGLINSQLIAAQAQVQWFQQYLQNPAPVVPASN